MSLEETRRVRDVAEAAVAEAKSVHGEVESRVATLAVQAEATTAHVVDALSKCVSKVAAQSEAQTSAHCWDSSPTTGKRY